MTDNTNHQAKLFDMIKDIRFAMFTTHKPEGHLHSRPMTMQNKSIDEDDSLWFFMARSSASVSEFQGNDQVNVSYANPSNDTYVSVSGIAEVVESETKKQMLWNTAAQSWFPKGVNDPELALVRVRIEHADYWDVKDNKLVQLYKMAKAAMTGVPPQNLGEHARVHPQ